MHRLENWLSEHEKVSMQKAGDQADSLLVQADIRSECRSGLSSLIPCRIIFGNRTRILA